jgi:cytoskeletal protein CcmA (bactofilin family)
MRTHYGYDLFNGRKVPQLAVSGDHVIQGEHSGTVHVESGTFTLEGTLKGTLDIQDGVRAKIVGKQQGTVSVAKGATVTVTGAIEGTVSVDTGAAVVVEHGGKLAGTLRNNGLVIVRGVFGGAQTGDGELRLEEAGFVKQPVTEDGMTVYRW